MASSISRRRLLHGVVAAATLARAWPARAQAADAGRSAMAAAATSFLATLDARQRRRAVFQFGDAERMNWHYVPRRREGLTFKDMASPSRAAAHELMKASLSTVGYAKAVNIIQLEEVLRQIEMLGLTRDPENYALTIFGTPGESGAWGWRLEGHHLSLNFTLVPGKPIAVTPAFMGANPARIPKGQRAGFRTLEHEQDLAFALARSLDPTLRGRAVIATESLGDIVSGPGRKELFAARQGLPVGAMSGDQRALAMRLIETYARNMPTEVPVEQRLQGSFVQS